MSRISCYDLIVTRRDGTEDRHDQVSAWNFHVQPPELTLYRDGEQIAFYGFSEWAKVVLASDPDHPIGINPVRAPC